jgi:hypothetical protein
MKSILFALGASTVLAAAASAQGGPPALEKVLAGTWTCSAEGNGMAVTSTTNYLAGGKETFDVAVKADAAGTQIEFTGDGTADWKWDDKLVETITAISIKTARMGGQEIPAADMQAMVEGMMVGQVSTSSVRINSDGKEMILVDTNEITTNCKR